MTPAPTTTTTPAPSNRDEQIAATREQILADQASGAKRDEDALETEREWYRQNPGKK